ncbi:MAG: DUF4335 domain-containing protein [Synechococcales cyanobacterium M58_A2018_015]|nr:DUF4335 domain-containing protein [Synechococcales cyanobacterium M58_A2018_015]
MPTSVLRRYTPPTCTLEVAATGSSLSRWTQRPTLGNLQFQLSFDDPKLLPDQQVTVKGSQAQLDALYETVETYVQSLLGQPTDQMLQEVIPTPWDTASTVAATGMPVMPEAPPEATVERQLQPDSSLSLQPRGLSHDLHLGTLATVETGAVVRLSTLQLFDLANALEEYHAEALTLPDLGRPTWLKTPNSWARIAAVSVLALGATAGLTKFVFDIANPTVQTASAPQQMEASSELQTEPLPPLLPPPIEPSPTITLQPVPPLPPEGATSSTDPNLPPVGNTTPPAPIPAVPSQSAAVPVPEGSADSQQITVIPDPEGVADPEAASIPPTNAPAAAPAAPPRLTGVGDLAPESDSAPASIARSQAVSPAPEVAANRSTAFDTIPQVAEVRNFFQSTWQPPSELTQTLEYRLLLNSDGSLQRIVPLGQLSANYIDRTNMPLMGEAFVSPTTDGSTPQIRLVLKPDGSVQTFLEYAN